MISLEDKSKEGDTYEEHLIAKRIIKNRVDHSFLFWRNLEDGSQKIVIYGGRDHEATSKVPSKIHDCSHEDKKPSMNLNEDSIK